MKPMDLGNTGVCFMTVRVSMCVVCACACMHAERREGASAQKWKQMVFVYEWQLVRG